MSKCIKPYFKYLRTTSFTLFLGMVQILLNSKDWDAIFASETSTHPSWFYSVGLSRASPCGQKSFSNRLYSYILWYRWFRCRSSTLLSATSSFKNSKSKEIGGTSCLFQFFHSSFLCASVPWCRISLWFGTSSGQRSIISTGIFFRCCLSCITWRTAKSLTPAL